MVGILVLNIIWFLAYQFLPRAPEGGSIGYTELPHILIMLGVFWSVSLFYISLLQGSASKARTTYWFHYQSSVLF
jgi:hypothetical protein